MKYQKLNIKNQKSELSLRGAQRRSSPFVIPAKAGIAVRPFAIFAIAFLFFAALIFAPAPAQAASCLCYDDPTAVTTMEEFNALQDPQCYEDAVSSWLDCGSVALTEQRCEGFDAPTCSDTRMAELRAQQEAQKSAKLIELTLPVVVPTITPVATREPGYCLCATPLDNILPENLSKVGSSDCKFVPDQNDCLASADKYSFISSSDDCNFYNDQQTCADAQSKWEKDKEKLNKDLTSASSTKTKFLPDCILENTLDKNSPCRDIGIFIVLGINIANYLFGIIGALALLMFIYGGVMLVISQGNPEKVKAGTDAMLAAVIGIVIVFSAYLLVGFAAQVIGVPGNVL